jgi:signal transduction histidine kinase
VVINLVTNAREAVLARRPGSAAVTVGDDAGAALDAALLPPVHVIARLTDADHVEIVVVDRGVGMSDVEVVRMFEPFFTTKRRGSGIGLAVSKNIVDGLGGRIDVESQPGTGTTLRLTLPRFRPAPASPDTTSRPASAPQASPSPESASRSPASTRRA